MRERIKKVMDYKGISAGDLATICKVQRSNISHILNGRNKPGAAFIEKFLLSFPDINARWFMTGMGEMLENENIIEPGSPEELNNEPEITNSGFHDVEEKSKQIDKLIILFSDGTFSIYKQND
jgi:transcriptional regulator with XRE-family HTH domain